MNRETLAALEPLLCPPEEVAPPQVVNPRPLTPGEALYAIVEDGYQRHADAQYMVMQCRHRLALKHYFTPKQLKDARRQLREQTAIVEEFAFYTRCFLGFPLVVWGFHQDTLSVLLEAAKANECDGWRYEGVSVSQMLAALVEVGGEG